MPEVRPVKIAHDELQAFREQGFVRLGPVAPVHVIEELCRRIDEIMMGEVVYPNMLMQLCPSAGRPESFEQTRTFKGRSLNYRKIQDLEQDPLFLDYLSSPLFRDICLRIIGRRVSIYRAMFFNKPAEQGVTINWHADGVGDWADDWDLDIPPAFSLWTALDASRMENGCLRIIPGSHIRRLASRNSRPSTSEIEAQVPPAERLHLEMEAGEVVLLDNRTLHTSGTNRTDCPRRAFSVCYIDSATRDTTTGRQFPRLFPNYRPSKFDAKAR
jgi:hypothetical protein